MSSCSVSSVSLLRLFTSSKLFVTSLGDCSGSSVSVFDVSQPITPPVTSLVISIAVGMASLPVRITTPSATTTTSFSIYIPEVCPESMPCLFCMAPLNYTMCWYPIATYIFIAILVALGVYIIAFFVPMVTFFATVYGSCRKWTVVHITTNKEKATACELAAKEIVSKLGKDADLNSAETDVIIDDVIATYPTTLIDKKSVINRVKVSLHSKRGFAALAAVSMLSSANAQITITPLSSPTVSPTPISVGSTINIFEEVYTQFDQRVRSTTTYSYDSTTSTTTATIDNAHAPIFNGQGTGCVGFKAITNPTLNMRVTGLCVGLPRLTARYTGLYSSAYDWSNNIDSDSNEWLSVANTGAVNAIQGKDGNGVGCRTIAYQSSDVSAISADQALCAGAAGRCRTGLLGIGAGASATGVQIGYNMIGKSVQMDLDVTLYTGVGATTNAPPVTVSSIVSRTLTWKISAKPSGDGVDITYPDPIPTITTTGAAGTTSLTLSTGQSIPSELTMFQSAIIDIPISIDIENKVSKSTAYSTYAVPSWKSTLLPPNAESLPVGWNCNPCDRVASDTPILPGNVGALLDNGIMSEFLTFGFRFTRQPYDPAFNPKGGNDLGCMFRWGNCGGNGVAIPFGGNNYRAWVMTIAYPGCVGNTGDGGVSDMYVIVVDACTKWFSDSLYYGQNSNQAPSLPNEYCVFNTPQDCNKNVFMRDICIANMFQLFNINWAMRHSSQGTSDIWDIIRKFPLDGFAKTTGVIKHASSVWGTPCIMNYHGINDASNYWSKDYFNANVKPKYTCKSNEDSYWPACEIPDNSASLVYGDLFESYDQDVNFALINKRFLLLRRDYNIFKKFFSDACTATSVPPYSGGPPGYNKYMSAFLTSISTCTINESGASVCPSKAACTINRETGQSARITCQIPGDAMGTSSNGHTCISVHPYFLTPDVSFTTDCDKFQGNSQTPSGSIPLAVTGGSLSTYTFPHIGDCQSADIPVMRWRPDPALSTRAPTDIKQDRCPNTVLTEGCVPPVSDACWFLPLGRNSAGVWYDHSETAIPNAPIGDWIPHPLSFSFTDGVKNLNLGVFPVDLERNDAVGVFNYQLIIKNGTGSTPMARSDFDILTPYRCPQVPGSSITGVILGQAGMRTPLEVNFTVSVIPTAGVWGQLFAGYQSMPDAGGAGNVVLIEDFIAAIPPGTDPRDVLVTAGMLVTFPKDSTVANIKMSFWKDRDGGLCAPVPVTLTFSWWNPEIAPVNNNTKNDTPDISNGWSMYYPWIFGIGGGIFGLLVVGLIIYLAIRCAPLGALNKLGSAGTSKISIQSPGLGAVPTKQITNIVANQSKAE